MTLWRIVSLSALALGATVARAQDEVQPVLRSLTQFDVQTLLAPQIVQPQIAVPTFEAPPSGFWNLPGAELAETQPGTAFVVVDSRQVGSIGGASQWIRIAPVVTADGAATYDMSGAVWVPYDPATVGPILMQLGTTGGGTE